VWGKEGQRKKERREWCKKGTKKTKEAVSMTRKRGNKESEKEIHE
jgi:hypothetical protein